MDEITCSMHGENEKCSTYCNIHKSNFLCAVYWHVS